MSKPTEQELKEFINALQLSIKTKINDIRIVDEEGEMVFDSRPSRSDTNLHNFLQLFDGEWKENAKCFVFYGASKFNWPKLTLFLLLTRMDEGNISKLIELDESAREIAEKIGLKLSHANIESVKKCSQVIFQKMENQNMTIRELAEKTGLTQVSISNFKAGNDIRLSNFIKIVGAVGMNLKIK